MRWERRAKSPTIGWGVTGQEAQNSRGYGIYEGVETD